MLQKGYELDLSSEDQEKNENELPMELVMPKALETELQIIKDTKAKNNKRQIAEGKNYEDDLDRRQEIPKIRQIVKGGAPCQEVNKISSIEAERNKAVALT